MRRRTNEMLRAACAALVAGAMTFAATGCGVGARVGAWHEIRQGYQERRADRPEEAARHFVRALQYRPDSADAWMGYGLAALAERDSERAADVFAELLRRRPHDHRAAHHLGLALLRLGRTDEAEANFRRALAGRPRYLPSIYGMGLVAEQRGDTDAALRWFLRALDLDPRSPILHRKITDLARTS